MPDQPHSFCDEVTGSVNEEKAMLSFTLTLSEAFDTVSPIVPVAKLGYKAKM